MISLLLYLKVPARYALPLGILFDILIVVILRKLIHG